ncbi:plasma membrane localization protein [Cryptotrichosporon argae]
MSCLPCASLKPEHKLLSACYPAAGHAAGAGAGADRASTEDVQRLAAFANARPAKLGAIGDELEKRIVRDGARASSGQGKHRATLLVSLDILRRLIGACKSDLALLARPALRAITAALDVRASPRGPLDLDVLVRAGQCFAAFADYTDGEGVGADDGALAYAYGTTLQKLAALATYDFEGRGEKTGDAEARIRVAGLAGLGAAAASEALLAGTPDGFSKQAAIIVPPVLANLHDAPLDTARTESVRLGADTSPFNATAARRASTTGDKTASPNVLGAALRALHALASQSQLEQMSRLLRAVLAHLDESALWNSVDFCVWLGERLAALAQLQYRLVVPKYLSELLVGLPDTVPPTTKQMALGDMLAAILSSPVSIVGLSIPELLDHILAVVVRRVRVDDGDALLAPLVRVIAAVPTHIYYADQISDAVEEIAGRIAQVPVDDEARQDILRVLASAMRALLIGAADADATAQPAAGEAPPNSFFELQPPRPPHVGKGKAPQIGTPLPTPSLEAPWCAARRRHPVALEVWQGTLPLLCEATYPVRAAYARAFLYFLDHEMPREPRGQAKPDERVVRFCHAANAALYTLAMSSALGPEPDLETSAPAPELASATPPVQTCDLEPVAGVPLANGSVNGTGAAGATAGPVLAPAIVTAGGTGSVTPPRKDSAKGVTFNLVEPTPDDSGASTPSGGATGTTVKRRASRRLSLPLNRLNSAVRLPSPDAVATPFDYAFLVALIGGLHAAVPAAALLTGAPMLLALDRDAGNELVRRAGDGRAGAYSLERKRAAREAVALAWRRIARRWGAAAAADAAARALADMPEPFVVPDVPPAPARYGADGTPLDHAADPIPPADETVIFARHDLEGETSATSRPLLDPAALVASLAEARAVQSSTGMGADELARTLGAPWSVDVAIRESVERDAADDADGPPRPSDASLYSTATRPLSRAQVSVEDLREALVGGAGAGTRDLPSAASSFVSARRPFSLSPAPQKPRTDVKEVLRDIFGDAPVNASASASANANANEHAGGADGGAEGGANTDTGMVPGASGHA